MRTFIIEYIKRKAESDVKVNLEVHINLWNFKKQETIFDFGFMIDAIDEINSIILYVPFKIKEVQDLGKKISSNPVLVDAVFNERCETVKFYPKRIKVKKMGDYDTREGVKKEEEIFILYSLDEKQINFENYEEYSKIKLNTENILSEEERKSHSELVDKKYYFRIRFSPSDEKITMIKRENEEKNIIQEATLRITEIIDFRINDLRSCPENLREEFLRTPRFVMNKIHYLIMRNSTDEFVTIGDSEVNGRLLEKEIWKDYIEIEETDMIAYHIKATKAPIYTFLNLSRFKYPLNIKKTIILYIFIAIILSIISSAIYEVCKSLFVE